LERGIIVGSSTCKSNWLGKVGFLIVSLLPLR
jgi:hypothetical protein